jgi:co-chaperonin GroES (HSP10)
MTDRAFIQDQFRTESTAAVTGAARPAVLPEARRTRLLQDFVVLRFPSLPKSHTVAGTDVTLALPDNRYFRSTMRDATVVAVGPGRWVEKKSGGGKDRRTGATFQPTELRVGDRVLIDAMHTQEGLLSEWDGERGDFRIVVEGVIAGVLDADAVLEVA